MTVAPQPPPDAPPTSTTRRGKGLRFVDLDDVPEDDEDDDFDDEEPTVELPPNCHWCGRVLDLAKVKRPAPGAPTPKVACSCGAKCSVPTDELTRALDKRDAALAARRAERAKRRGEAPDV